MPPPRRNAELLHGSTRRVQHENQQENRLVSGRVDHRYLSVTELRQREMPVDRPPTRNAMDRGGASRPPPAPLDLSPPLPRSRSCPAPKLTQIEGSGRKSRTYTAGTAGPDTEAHLSPGALGLERDGAVWKGIRHWRPGHKGFGDADGGGIAGSHQNESGGGREVWWAACSHQNELGGGGGSGGPRVHIKTNWGGKVWWAACSHQNESGGGRSSGPRLHIKTNWGGEVWWAACSHQNKLGGEVWWAASSHQNELGGGLVGRMFASKQIRFTRH